MQCAWERKLCFKLFETVRVTVNSACSIFSGPRGPLGGSGGVWWAIIRLKLFQPCCYKHWLRSPRYYWFTTHTFNFTSALMVCSWGILELLNPKSPEREYFASVCSDIVLQLKVQPIAGDQVSWLSTDRKKHQTFADAIISIKKTSFFWQGRGRDQWDPLERVSFDHVFTLCSYRLFHIFIESLK